MIISLFLTVLQSLNSVPTCFLHVPCSHLFSSLYAVKINLWVPKSAAVDKHPPALQRFKFNFQLQCFQLVLALKTQLRIIIGWEDSEGIHPCRCSTDTCWLERVCVCVCEKGGWIGDFRYVLTAGMTTDVR